MHLLHAVPMLNAGTNDIDPRCVDATVSQYICELCNILFYCVKDFGKQMPEIMREHFFGIDICLITKILHLSPNIRAAHRFSGTGNKNHAGINPILLTIL